MDNYNTTQKTQKRLFIGIKIPLSENLNKLINSVKTELKPSQIKWTKPDNFHVTIRYLGNTPTYYINSINMAIEESIEECKSFELNLQSTGTFGSSKPKILWLGIKENYALNDIYHKVNKALEPLGFEFKEQAFHPHLTLGRIKHIYNNSVIKLISDRLNNQPPQQYTISEINLFESELRNEGPKYIILQSHKLK